MQVTPGNVNEQAPRHESDRSPATISECLAIAARMTEFGARPSEIAEALLQGGLARIQLLVVFRSLTGARLSDLKALGQWCSNSGVTDSERFDAAASALPWPAAHGPVSKSGTPDSGTGSMESLSIISRYTPVLSNAELLTAILVFVAGICTIAVPDPTHASLALPISMKTLVGSCFAIIGGGMIATCLRVLLGPHPFLAVGFNGLVARSVRASPLRSAIQEHDIPWRDLAEIRTCTSGIGRARPVMWIEIESRDGMIFRIPYCVLQVSDLSDLVMAQLDGKTSSKQLP